MTQAESDAAADQESAKQTLNELRSSVRQRQAELATIGDQSDEFRLRLADLRSGEFLQEPVAVSPRPLFGPLLVFMRKAFFHLFMKWYLRPLLTQLNSFNNSAAGLIRDLVDANRGLGEENRKLRRRVEALEAVLHAPPQSPRAE
jgi:cell division protein FtsB